MNVELLLKVKARILANPEHFNMDQFFCSTAACIAGHTLLEAGYKHRGDVENPYDMGIVTNPEGQTVCWMDTEAAKLLGVPVKIADELFYASSWYGELVHSERQKLQLRYMRLQHDKKFVEAAAVAAGRIDNFIARYGNLPPIAMKEI